MIEIIAMAYLFAAVVVAFAAQVVSAVYGAWCAVQWWNRRRLLRRAIADFTDEAEEPAE